MLVPAMESSQSVDEPGGSPAQPPRPPVDVFTVIRMIRVRARIFTDAAAELLQSADNNLSRRAAAAHIVQSNLETLPVKIANPGQIIGILERGSPETRSRRGRKRPDGFCRPEAKVSHEPIYRLDTFHRAVVGVIEDREGKILVVG